MDTENCTNLHSAAYKTRVHAKVNLALAVGQAEPTSSMHPICSWMHSINLCDELEIQKLPEQQESRYVLGWANEQGADTQVDWAIEQDLGVRAHKVIQEHVGRSLAAAIRVTKSIPAGGGLGGGSADAAGVLVGINTLFGLGLDHEVLVELATKLGSDIPFFIDPEHSVARSAIVGGMGEQIARLDSEHVGRQISLILPPFGCHTGRVYKAFDSLNKSESAYLRRVQDVQKLVESGNLDDSRLLNDLKLAAWIHQPELKIIQESLGHAINQRVHLSGSGSTFFVLGKIEAAGLKVLPEGCRVIETVLC